MEGGQITQSGSYEELLKAGTAFEQLVNAHKDAITTLGVSGRMEILTRPVNPTQTKEFLAIIDHEFFYVRTC